MAIGRKIRHPRIVQPGTGRRFWWLLALPVLFISLGWWLYSPGPGCPEPNMADLQAQLSLLQQQLVGLEGERAGLRQEVARLARASQIDREAAHGLREEIKVLQDERLALEQERTFLRRVLSDGAGNAVLQIKDFTLAAKVEEAAFRYDFVVSQARERAGPMVGKIHIRLEGVQNGKTGSLSLKALSDGAQDFVKMRFRRFQKVDGLLRVPKDFTPVRIVIDIQPDEEGIPPLAKAFDWAPKG